MALLDLIGSGVKFHAQLDKIDPLASVNSAVLTQGNRPIRLSAVDPVKIKRLPMPRVHISARPVVERIACGGAAQLELARTTLIPPMKRLGISSVESQGRFIELTQRYVRAAEGEPGVLIALLRQP